MSARLVKILCNVCRGKIEFDANQLQSRQQQIECPHCGQTTLICEPPPQLPKPFLRQHWLKLSIAGAALVMLLLGIVIGVSILVSQFKPPVAKAILGKWHLERGLHGNIGKLEFFKGGDLNFQDPYGLHLACRYQVLDANHLKIDYPFYQTGSTSIYRRGMVDNPAHSEICNFSITNDILTISAGTGYTYGENQLRQGDKSETNSRKSRNLGRAQ